MKIGDEVTVEFAAGSERCEFLGKEKGRLRVMRGDGSIKLVEKTQVTKVSTMDNAENETQEQGSTLSNLREARGHYHREKSGSGKDARFFIDCDDNIAEQLRGKELEDVYTIASEHTGVGVSDLKDKYEHLNKGMQRMNLGNRIRGAIAKKARGEAKNSEE